MATKEQQQQFIDRVGKLATTDMQTSGILASLTIAQAILESGWGTSELCRNASALFGIKADGRWAGKVYSKDTKECYDGANFTTVRALFRAYSSWEESIADHSAFLRAGSRYKAVIGETNYKAACKAIKAAGYATDPSYADKLISLIESYELTVYDKGKKEETNNMALLSPNATYSMNGVTVREKIIPDGTRWKDASKAAKAGFSAGSLYKKQKKLNGGTGTVKSVTVHNTNDLANVHDDGEQYTRATYNENMGSSRVHFYVDDTGAWQNLKAGTGLCPNDPEKSAEVSWHSGDGSVADGGNMTSLSIEIIMNESAAHDEKAKDNGARIAAWLLWKNGLSINDLVSHTYWVNKSAGKSFSDVDKQCTNPIYGEKWCPTYIFASSNPSVALKNWKAFKEVVKRYLDALNGTPTEAPAEKPETKPTEANEGAYNIGDNVMFKGGPHYTNANAASAASTPAAGPAKVTAISKGAKHPYHIIHTDDSSAVYGWVNASDIQAVSGNSAGNTNAEVIYTVVHGDSLWAIAERFLGDGNRYTEIKEANGLKDNTIYSGQKLKIPGANSGGSAAAPAPAKKTIQKGSIVRLKKGAKTYTGGSLASFVYTRDHIVSQIDGDRAVITYGGVVVAAVHTSDLIAK